MTSTDADAQPRTDRAAGVVDLDEAAATDPGLTGTKAAALARAATAGLPIVPGFVVTTAGTEELASGTTAGDDVLGPWQRLSRAGEVPLVVRSSSTVEDLGDSSMAGRFASVVGVRGRQEFDDAVRTVIASREQAAEAPTR